METASPPGKGWMDSFVVDGCTCASADYALSSTRIYTPCLKPVFVLGRRSQPCDDLQVRVTVRKHLRSKLRSYFDEQGAADLKLMLVYVEKRCDCRTLY